MDSSTQVEGVTLASSHTVIEEKMEFWEQIHTGGLICWWGLWKFFSNLIFLK